MNQIILVIEERKEAAKIGEKYSNSQKIEELKGIFDRPIRDRVLAKDAFFSFINSFNRIQTYNLFTKGFEDAYSLYGSIISGYLKKSYLLH